MFTLLASLFGVEALEAVCMFMSLHLSGGLQMELTMS